MSPAHRLNTCIPPSKSRLPKATPSNLDKTVPHTSEPVVPGARRCSFSPRCSATFPLRPLRGIPQPWTRTARARTYRQPPRQIHPQGIRIARPLHQPCQWVSWLWGSVNRILKSTLDTKARLSSNWQLLPTKTFFLAQTRKTQINTCRTPARHLLQLDSNDKPTYCCSATRHTPEIFLL